MKEKNPIIELNKRAWNNIAKDYEQNRPKWLGDAHPLFNFFYLNLPQGGYILDLGSGTGLPYAKVLTEKGFKVLGIDQSHRMVEIAKNNVLQAKFIQLSMTEIEFENVFDGIISSFSMLHLTPKLFKEVAVQIANALKKGALFYLSLNEPWEENVDVDKYTIIEIMGEKMYSRAYTEEEITAIFLPLGMKLLKIHREIQTSELFGEEHTLALIFKKI